MFSDKRYFCLPVILALAASSSFLGCSVKEDRDLCPCTLALDVFRNADCPDDLLISLTEEDGVASTDTFSLDGEATTVLVKAPRGASVSVLAISPASVSPESDGNIRIAEGDECPELWLASSEIDTTPEYVRDTVTLHKSWCRLRISVNDRVSGEFPFPIRLRGNVCGYSRAGLPLEGDFSVENRPEEGSCAFSVPRQKDTSLMMDIIDDSDVLRTFAIGEYLVRSGYDWNSEDLEDASITVNLSETAVSLTVDLWGREKSYEIVI